MKSNVARAPSVFCYAKSTYPLAVTWSSRAFSIASLPILPVLGDTVCEKQYSIVFHCTNLPEGGTVQTGVRWESLLPLEKANVQTDVREKGGGMRREQAPALQRADGCWWEAFPV